MLIGPDRLNAAVNGSDPLQWLAFGLAFASGKM